MVVMQPKNYDFENQRIALRRTMVGCLTDVPLAEKIAAPAAALVAGGYGYIHSCILRQPSRWQPRTLLKPSPSAPPQGDAHAVLRRILLEEKRCPQRR